MRILVLFLLVASSGIGGNPDLSDACRGLFLLHDWEPESCTDAAGG